MNDSLPHLPDDGVRKAIRALFDGYPGGAPDGASGAESRTRLATLVGLFHRGQSLPVAEFDTTLGRIAAEALRASCLVETTDAGVRPAVRLLRFGQQLIAADVQARHARAEADFVLAPSGPTGKLGSFMLPGPHESVLDLGCAGGALALAASDSARRVVATDVSERATAFARFSADLNGVERVEVRTGSLYAPVEGERFDLILCNPPYAITPDETFVYRDGGTEISRAVVQGAQDHLLPNGHLQMLVEWPKRAGARWSAEIEAWLDGLDLDAWVLRQYQIGPRQYAETWLKQEHYLRGSIPEGEVERWMRHLDAQGIESVVGGLLVVGRDPGRRPVRTFRDAPPPRPGRVGASLARWLAAQKLVADVGDATGLLDASLAPAPFLERVARAEPTGGGWEVTGTLLRAREGLRFGARVDPVAEEVVGMLGPGTTPRRAIEELAQRYGAPVGLFLNGLPGALEKLLELGLIVPASSHPDAVTALQANESVHS